MATLTTQQQFGLRVREYRHRRGLTQQALADACGISQPRIAEIETGRSNPALETMEKIAKALNVPLSTLLRPTA